MLHYFQLTPRELVKWQVAHRDRRFAEDPQFLSFVHGFLEGKDLTSALAVQVQMSKAKLGGAQFNEQMQQGQRELEVRSLAFR